MGTNHGTLGGYNGGCRCELCRAARRSYDRERERRVRPSRIQRLAEAAEFMLALVNVVYGDDKYSPEGDPDLPEEAEFRHYARVIDEALGR